jgi:hypothetical protein
VSNRRHPNQQQPKEPEIFADIVVQLHDVKKPLVYSNAALIPMALGDHAFFCVKEALGDKQAHYLNAASILSLSCTPTRIETPSLVSVP